MTPSDWDQLFDAFSTGNDNNLHDLFQRLGEYLLWVAQDRIQSKPELAEDAHDCVQDALVAIWQAIKKRAGPEQRRTTQSWATQIIIHKVLDLLRKRGFSISSSETGELRPQGKFVELNEEIALANDFSDDVQQQADYSVAIRRILNHPKLTKDERVVIYLRYLEDTEDDEIATTLGIARTTVRVKCMRALQKLRDDPDMLDWLRSLF
ncbi:MAG: RNA polymerase sigma factor [Caldilineaceae bacterium]